MKKFKETMKNIGIIVALFALLIIPYITAYNGFIKDMDADLSAEYEAREESIQAENTRPTLPDFTEETEPVEEIVEPEVEQIEEEPTELVNEILKSIEESTTSTEVTIYIIYGDTTVQTTAPLETNEETAQEEQEANIDPTKNVTRKISDVNPYEGYFTQWMDLQNRIDITEEDMNTLIDEYTKDYPDSLLKGQGWAFIEASRITGYDPIFLFALTGQEAGWNVHTLHRSKNNPYSIAMYTEDPSQGYVLGDTYSDGIINGAIWLKENYYDTGAQCLHTMEERGYAEDPNWKPSIVSIMDKCYSILFKS